MRVLHFYKTAIPSSMGGVEQVIDQLCRATTALGVSNEVLYLSKRPNPKSFNIHGYTVHRAKLDFEIASTGFSLSAITRFKYLSSQADVIHFHFPWPFMDCVHFLSNHNKPTIVTYHSDIIRQTNLAKLYGPLQSWFLRDMDAIVVTSPNYLKTSNVLSKHTEKTSIIPIGLNEKTYPSVTKRELNEWRIKHKKPFFLFVGVLRYYKGLHILLEAAAMNNYPVIIVGVGNMEAELKEKVTRLGLKNVRFLGFLEDVDKIKLIKLSYAIVFPSNMRSEAFGVSLLEGAMFGKPMISSEIGTGTSFINIDGETGIVVKPGDPAALSTAMETLWKNPDKAKKMGIAARERFKGCFDSKEMAKSYVKLYKRLVNRS